MNKVGIFSGTFDPVHSGHIAFALESIKTCKLDKIYFLPEALPRRKSGVTHLAHRLAMLELALKPYPKLKVMDIPDKQFNVNTTLPKIKKRLPESELFLLIGSDVLEMLDSPEVHKQWPEYDRLLKKVVLIAGIRNSDQIDYYKQMMERVQESGKVVSTDRYYMSSKDIRRAVMAGKTENGLLSSLRKYVDNNWLYVSVDPNNS